MEKGGIQLSLKRGGRAQGGDNRRAAPGGQADRRRHKQTNKQTDRQTARQTDRQTGRQTDTKTDRQTDRPTGRQTDRHAVLLARS